MSTDHDHDDDDRDDAPALPERSVLEAWRVPLPSVDLTDRVLAHVEAGLPMGTVAVLPVAPRRKTLGVAVVAVAMAAAATLVLGLAQSWRRAPASEPTPAAVTAPASDAEPASPAPTREEAAPERPVPDFVPAASSVPPAGGEATVEPTEPGAEPLGATKPSREPDDAKLATLKIGTTQGSAPATVFIDGERIGFTPLKADRVTPGRHEVRWEWADGTSASLTVEVGAGAALTLKNPPPSAPGSSAPSSSPGFDDPFAGRADRPASGPSSPGVKDPFSRPPSP